MKRISRKFTALLLTAILIFGSIAVDAAEIGFAEMFTTKAEAVEYSGTCGDNLTWTLDTDTGELTISGTGDMWDWDSYSSDVPWYSNRSSIKMVTIQNDVTSIGNWAFYNCTSLKSISFGENSQLTRIGKYAFEECGCLTIIELPDSVIRIGDSAFSYCSSLTSIGIPTGVTTIGVNSFSSCKSLIRIEIPTSVISIGKWAFYNCTSLTSINVAVDNAYYSSDEYGVLFNKDKTNLIQYPAGNLGTYYGIPDSVISIGDSAFFNCSRLTSIGISTSVTSIGSFAFCSCTNLTSIKIPSSVTSIGTHAFAGCTSLTSIEIPSSVTSIVTNTFYGCDHLEYVHFPTSVTTIGDVILRGTTAYICSTSEDCYAKTYADENGYEFRLCTGHGDDVDEPATLTKVEVVEYPAKTEYVVGDALDTTGMMLLLTYSDGSSKTATVGYECDSTVLNTVGTQVITVTYGGKSCTFEVEVVEKSEETTVPESTTKPESTTNPTVPESTTMPESITNPTVPEPTTRPESTTNPTVPEATTRPESTTKPVISEEITTPDADNKYTLQIRTKTYELKYNQHTKMSAVILPENSGNHTVVWSSSDSSVATVNQEGKVTACGEGEVIISATLVDSNGNVVADRYGNEVSDKVLVKCTMTVWQKIVRFFENLFNAFFTFNAESDMFKTK